MTSSTDALGNTTTMTYDIRGNMLSRTDALGNVTTWTYAGAGKVLTRVDPHDPNDDPADHTVQFTYTGIPFYRVSSETNKAGGTIYRDHDGLGNLTQIADDAGNVISTMTRSNFGKLLSKTDRFGTKTYEYTSGVSQPTRVVDGHGVETVFAYDNANRMIRMTRAGVVAEFTYDSAGRELRRDYGNGVTVDFGYSVGAAEWTFLSGPTFGTVTRTFSKTGRLVGWTKPNGDTFSREFDGGGRISTETDEMGNRTVYQYDSAGRLENTTREVDSVTTNLDRDAAGNVTSTSSNGNSSLAVYEYGRLVSRTNALGATSTRVDTPRIISATDALGRVTSIHLTQHGLLDSVTSPSGRVTSSSFLGTTKIGQAEAYPTSHTDAGGRSKEFTYAQSELASAGVLGDSDVWDYTFENIAQGRITFDIQSGEVSLLSQRQVLVPHHLKTGGGVVLQSSVPGKIDGRDTRDWPRRLRSVTSPLGEADQFDYNEQGLLSSRTYPSGAVESLGYSAGGRVATQTKPDGTQLVFTHDSAGRELSRASSGGTTRSFVYGPGSRIETATNNTDVITYTYSAAGRIATVGGSHGAVEYGYSTRGEISEVSVDVGAIRRTTSYAFDAVGRMVSVVDPLGGITVFNYDLAGRLSNRTLPNGVVSAWTYDVDDRIVRVEHADDVGTVLISRDYARADGGEPTRITTQSGDYLDVEYDGDLQIISERYFDASDVLLDEILYTYDADGRRASRTLNGDVDSYEYVAGSILDRIEAEGVIRVQFSHDINGRSTGIDGNGDVLSLAFNDDDGVTGISDTAGIVVSYEFDALGGRSSATHAGEMRSFIIAPNPSSGLPSQYGVLDEQGVLIASYVYAGEHPLMKIDSTGQATYYLQSPQGTTLGISDSNGVLAAEFTYDSFGNPRSSAGVLASLPNDSLGDFRFQGMWLDETGFYFVRARSYDPKTGRFLSRDPFAGQIETPQTMRPYAFVGNNPWMGRDPTVRNTLVDTLVSLDVHGVLQATAIVAITAIAAATTATCVVNYVSGAPGYTGPCTRGRKVFVHRGVNRDHPGRFLALMGLAYARGGDATGSQHNMGNTASPFISVSTNRVTAMLFTIPRPGAMIDAYVPIERIYRSPDVSDEAELLVIGFLQGRGSPVY